MIKKSMDYICCSVAAVFTVAQTNEIFQLISLILTCLATLTAFAFTIYKWIKKASEDGKIDQDELEELADIIKDGADKLKDKIDKDKK